jgi:MFS family permease
VPLSGGSKGGWRKRPLGPSGPSDHSRYTALSLYLPAFILALGTGIAAPALPIYAKSFEVTFGVASLVIVVHTLGSLCATLPAGFLIDRFGRRRVILAGPILTAVATLLVATAHSFPELLVYRFAAGWGNQMWVLSRLAVVADTGEGRRGRQITGMFGMDASGRLFGPALGGFVAAAWDIRAPFVLHAIVALLAVIPSYLLIRESLPTRSTVVEATKPTRGLSAAALLLSPFLFLYVAQLLVSLTRGTLYGGTLNLFAAYAYDVGPDTLGVLAAATSAVGIPITFASGHLSDRFGRKAVIMPGLTLVGLGLGFMAIIAYTGWPFSSFVAAALFVQASQSVMSGSMQTLAADIAPTHARGKFLGLWRLTGELGAFVSPGIFALLAEVSGFTASFAFLSATGLAGALLIGTRVRETLPGKHKRPMGGLVRADAV